MKDIFRIFKYILPYKWAAIGNVFFNLLSTIFTLFSFGLVIPFLNVLFGQQELVTEIQPWSMNSNVLLHNFKFWLSGIIIEHGELKALVMLGILVSVATLGKTATWYFATFFMVPVRNGVVRDIRNRLYKKILALHIEYCSEEKRGNIIARMTNDVQEIDFSIMSSMSILFRDPIKIIAFVGALFALNYKLTLFVLLILPIAGLIIGRIGKSLRRRSQDAQ